MPMPVTHMFKVTHQHSTIPDNNYSQKHILFSHNFQRLQRPHENGACFHAALEIIPEDSALMQPPEPLKIVRVFVWFFEAAELQKSVFQSCFKNKGLVQPSAASGRPQGPVKTKENTT